MDHTDIRSGRYTRVPMYRELRINSFDFMSLVKAMDLRGYCIFLESAGKTRDKGRFSFLCFNPVEIVSEENGFVRVTKNGKAEVALNFFANRYRKDFQNYHAIVCYKNKSPIIVDIVRKKKN